MWKGRGKITKNWISQEQKERFRWNEKSFSQFLKGYHLVKKQKFDKKIADTSFKNKNLVVVSGDKESCVVLIDKTDYQDKLQKMVEDGIKNGIYKVAEDNTLKDLKLFKSFLYRNFRRYEHYEEMLPKC